MARPASDLSDRLLDAARDHFLRQGVDGASLRAIARDADSNIGMIYYHFRTKDDLFMAVVERVYGPLQEDLAAALNPERTVAERMHALYARFGALDDQEFMVVRLLIREALVSSERIGQIIERFQGGHMPLLLIALRDGMLDGTLDKNLHPMALLAAVMTLAIFPQVVRRRLPEAALPFADPPAPPELAQAMCEVLLRGAKG